MAKQIPSPFLAAPPPSRHIRAVGDMPNHPIYSLEEELVILPFFFTINGGNLVTQQAGARCWVEQLSLGEMRVHHPYAQPKSVSFFLSRDASQSYLVDHTTAAQGYSDMVVGTSTATWEGFISIRATKETHVHAQGTEHPDKTLAERTQDTVQAPMQGLTVGFYGFIADASADPAPASYFGGLSFHVEHTDVGIYTFSTTAEFPPEMTFVAETDGRNCQAYPGAAPNQIVVETKSGGVLSDPLENAVVRVIALGPTTNAGRGFQAEVNTMKPTLQHARDGAFPACGLMRDMSFIPITFAVDGAGEVLYDDDDTVLPNNVTITKVVDDYQIEFGQCLRDLTLFAFHDGGTGGTFPVVTTEVETLGRITVAPALAIDTTVVHGIIIAAFNSER